MTVCPCTGRRPFAIERPLRTRVQVMSFDGVRRMVQEGLGVANLPYGAVLRPRRVGDGFYLITEGRTDFLDRRPPR